MKLDKTIFNGINVLVIGDVMIDQYMQGLVRRKSPEADIPVLEDVSIRSELGGAANVAHNIKLLGANPSILSVIGQDIPGQKIENMLAFKEIESYLIPDPSRQTTVKTRVYKGKEQLIRVDRENKHDLHPGIDLIFMDKLKSILLSNSVDIIILQDYNKGVLHQNNISAIINLAKEHKIFISVDPKVNNFDLYRDIDLFKPNLNELMTNLDNQEISDMKIEEILSIVNIKKTIIAATTFLLTLSDRGAMILDKEGSCYKNALPLDIVDVCGAGDAVISIATLGQFKGIGKEKILQLCIETGKIVCEKTGVSGISIDELNNKEIN